MLIEFTSNYDNQEYPVYIHFIQSKLNKLPDFLQKRKDIGLVLEKQFENLEININYLNVTLFFSGKPYNLSIHLSTISSIEVMSHSKITFPRNKAEYIKSIEESCLDVNEYLKNFLNTYDKCFNKNFIKKISIEKENNKPLKQEEKIATIENIINKKN